MENPPNGNFKVEFEANETWKDEKPLNPLNCVKVEETSNPNDLCDEPKPKKSKKEDDKRTFDCDKCKRKFPLEWYFKAHLCTDVTRLKQLLRCKICSKKCVDPSHLQTHMLNKHPDHLPSKKESNVVPKPRIVVHNPSYYCEFCQKTFNYKSSLTAHLYEHFGEKPFNCDICYRDFNQKQHLQVHYSKVHPDVTFPDATFMEDPQKKMLKCKFCSESKFGVSGLLDHYKTCHPDSNEANGTPNAKKYHNLWDRSKVFQCELCEYCCSRKSILKKHVLEYHPEADEEVLERVENLQLNCATCGDVFDSWLKLMSHVKSMHESNESVDSANSVPQIQNYSSDSFQCELCYNSRIVFLSLDELKKHKRIKHKLFPE